MHTEPTLWDGFFCVAFWLMGMYCLFRRQFRMYLRRVFGIRLHYYGLAAIVMGIGFIITAIFTSYLHVAFYNESVPAVGGNWGSVYYFGIIVIIAPAFILASLIHLISKPFQRKPESDK